MIGGESHAILATNRGRHDLYAVDACWSSMQTGNPTKKFPGEHLVEADRAVQTGRRDSVDQGHLFGR